VATHLLAHGFDAEPEGADALYEKLRRELSELRSAHEKSEAEREQYRALYLDLLERYKKLEQGILAQKRSERMRTSEYQLALDLLGTLLGREDLAPPEPEAGPEGPPPKPDRPPRPKPTGRQRPPKSLPRITVRVLPPEVERQGLDAFDEIGVETTEVIERRTASFVVLEIQKPKLVPKDRRRDTATEVHVAPTPDLPIERGKAGPGLLADTAVRRWQDHLPLHRLESIYAREGLELSRSTLCRWQQMLAELLRPLVDAMHADALRSPYLCVDATGVLVRAPKRCAHGHFFVVVAPERHVLFFYKDRHDSAAVDAVLEGYRGYLVVDAHSVYDHLFVSGERLECGCWAHARRYHFKALGTDPERAETALAWMRALFEIERRIDGEPAARKKRIRQAESKPIVARYLAWCDEQAEHVLDDTPIAAAIRYSRNQREALQAYLGDGRLPMTNNISERELRREAVGRKNWLFLGSPEAGEVNTIFVSLLASCALHGIEPWGYLRDLFCLLPTWPRRRVLELAPAYCRETFQQPDAQQRLAQNIFRRASIGELVPH